MDELIAYLVEATNRVKGSVLFLSGAIILIVIIWGGIQYIQGDAEGGKKTITSAIIGAVIISLAGILIDIVYSILR